MNPLYRLPLLYAFYGNLLTERQRTFFEMRYYQDLSLGEIAENLRISRAAVHDGLERAEDELELLEEKLGVVAQHLRERSMLSKLESILNELEVVDSSKSRVQEARAIVRSLLEGSMDDGV
ncbi:MAG TPA: DNA-binding protein [Firmicutes bacterium]|nr:DNA-binding protein [Bacillota bacterium]